MTEQPQAKLLDLSTDEQEKIAACADLYFLNIKNLIGEMPDGFIRPASGEVKINFKFFNDAKKYMAAIYYALTNMERIFLDAMDREETDGGD